MQKRSLGFTIEIETSRATSLKCTHLQPSRAFVMQILLNFMIISRLKRSSNLHLKSFQIVTKTDFITFSFVFGSAPWLFYPRTLSIAFQCEYLIILAAKADCRKKSDSTSDKERASEPILKQIDNIHEMISTDQIESKSAPPYRHAVICKPKIVRIVSTLISILTHVSS